MKYIPPEKQACYIDYLYGCIFAYGTQINKNYSGQQSSSTIFSQAISKHQFLINPLPWAGLWTTCTFILLTGYSLILLAKFFSIIIDFAHTTDSVVFTSEYG